MKKMILLAICTMLMLTACNGTTVEEIPSEPTSSIAESSEVSSEPISSQEESKPASSETPSSEVESSKPTSSKIDKPVASTNPPPVSSATSSTVDPEAISTARVEFNVTDTYGFPLENFYCQFGFMPPATNNSEKIFYKDYSGYTDISGRLQLSAIEQDASQQKCILYIRFEHDKNFKVTYTASGNEVLEALAKRDGELFSASITVYKIKPAPRLERDTTITFNVVIEELPAV